MPAEETDRRKLRIGRRLLLARRELEGGEGTFPECAVELLGSAVADWVLTASHDDGLVALTQDAPSTSTQLEALRSGGFLDWRTFSILATAYRARNVVHHQQTPIESRLALRIVDTVLSVVAPSLPRSFVPPDLSPPSDDELRALEAEVRLLRKAAIGPRKPKHLGIILHLDSEHVFDPDFGPQRFGSAERKDIVRATACRGMLAGIIRNHHWPLIACTACQAIVPIDNCRTPQDEVFTGKREPIEAYCDFGCRSIHSEVMSRLMDETEHGLAIYSGQYYKQNTVEMIRIGHDEE